MRSNLRYVSSVMLAAIFLTCSCGTGRRPDKLTVRVPNHSSGRIRIMPCRVAAPNREVMLDEHHSGVTSFCPDTTGTVEIEVIEPDRHYMLGSSEVTISRTGDGFPVSIEAELRQ